MSDHGLDASEREQLEVSIRSLIERLYPICRSITGNGVRETLDILSEVAAIERSEVPSGTPVLDWTVPDEWNIRDAWIKNSDGERVVDFREHNLHVVNYSLPVHETLSLADLKPHLHTLPEHPDWIPYRTSYYNPTWGFCLRESQLEQLKRGTGPFEVCIDSSLEPGHLTYGEIFLPGESDREILLSTHICHPSLCNDNLSALCLAVHLARHLSGRKRRYGVRFLFIPGTVGSIAWLARNPDRLGNIAHGMTLVCLGDSAKLSYKKTVFGNAEIDRVVLSVLASRGEFGEVEFYPYGYDERQFNSPGFRLPVGSLVRGRHGQFPEYHTSADNPDFVSEAQIVDALEAVLQILETLEANRHYRNLVPYGEPQLGKRGIYRAMGGENDPAELQFAMLWVLNLSDGEHDLLSIAERAEIPFDVVRRAAQILENHDLLELARSEET